MTKSSKNTLSPTKRFFLLLQPDKKEIKNVYIYAIFSGLLSLSLPLGIQAIVNLIQGGQMNTSWIVLVVFVVLGVAFTGILQIFQLRITENLQQRIFTRAAFEFAYRIPRIKMEALYKHYAPELMNRFFDILSVQKGLSKMLLDFSTALLHIIFGIILLSFYHPFFILFGLILIVLIIGIIAFTGKRGLATSLVESKHKYKLAHWLEELARASTTFKLVGRTKLPLERTNEHITAYLEARESHFNVLVQQFSLLVFFKVMVATGLLAIGGILVMEQHMNIGQFIAAEIIVLLIMSSVEKLIASMDTIYDVLTSLEKIGQVTDLELENSEGVDITKSCIENGLSISMKKVVFSYPDNENKIVSDLSLTVEKGERLMITGPNGSGKSTLLNLMAGLYDVQSGSITYNGLSKSNLKVSCLRMMIGDCLSQEQLFDGTILDNIQLGREDVSFEKVQWAVANLKLQSFIDQLPKGFNSHIDPQGKKLPRSVIQKILIARSIVNNPSLLLLEDAFEHINEEERNTIIDFLCSADHSWGIIAVSSDRYLGEKLGKLAIMENGSISAIGEFSALKTLAKLN